MDKVKLIKPKLKFRTCIVNVKQFIDNLEEVVPKNINEIKKDEHSKDIQSNDIQDKNNKNKSNISNKI